MPTLHNKCTTRVDLKCKETVETVVSLFALFVENYEEADKKELGEDYPKMNANDKKTPS